MASENRQSRLSLEISRILAGGDKTPSANSERQLFTNPAARSMVYGSMAALVMAPVQTGAVALGDITVRSTLGEPLRATVPLQTSKGETLVPNCITVPNRSSSGLDGLKDTKLSFTPGAKAGEFNLQIRTIKPLYEPMYELALRVDCPGAPQLIRQYVLMLDLPGLALPADPFTTPITATPDVQAVAGSFGRVPTPVRGSTSRLSPTSGNLPAGQTYRVRQGDNLSMIANRVDGRPADSTWKIANLIFRMNPHAFIRGNPDLLKLGTEIRIPDASDWSGPVETLNVAVSSAENPSSAETIGRTPSPAIRRDAEAVVQTERLSSDVEADTATTPKAAGEPQAEIQLIDTPVAARKAVPDLAVSPFMDEQATPEGVEPVIEAPVIAPPVTATATSATRPDSTQGQLSALTAIGIGILFGLAISILLLRTKFLGFVHGLLSRKNRNEDEFDDVFFGNTEDMFSTNAINIDSSADVPAPSTVAVKHMKAQDYTVEINEAAVTSDNQTNNIAAQTDAAPEASAPSADDTLLDNLFDDAGLTAELMTANVEEIFAEADQPLSTPTPPEASTQPELSQNDLLSGPTAEMPKFDSDVDEQTAEMPAAPSDETVINTAADALDEFIDEARTQGSSPALTETRELDLKKLTEAAAAAESDDNLSETLAEALTMLEKDYEEEFTASCIVDQDAMLKALEEDLIDDDEDENERTVKTAKAEPQA
jgi:hypothetical protein